MDFKLKCTLKSSGDLVKWQFPGYRPEILVHWVRVDLQICIFNKLTGDVIDTDLEITRSWNFLPRDIGQCVEAFFCPSGGNRRTLLASRGQKPRVLLNI